MRINRWLVVFKTRRRKVLDSAWRWISRLASRRRTERFSLAPSSIKQSAVFLLYWFNREIICWRNRVASLVKRFKLVLLALRRWPFLLLIQNLARLSRNVLRVFLRARFRGVQLVLRIVQNLNLIVHVYHYITVVFPAVLDVFPRLLLRRIIVVWRLFLRRQRIAGNFGFLRLWSWFLRRFLHWLRDFFWRLNWFLLFWLWLDIEAVRQKL